MQSSQTFVNLSKRIPAACISFKVTQCSFLVVSNIFGGVNKCWFYPLH